MALLLAACVAACAPDPSVAPIEGATQVKIFVARGTPLGDALARGQSGQLLRQIVKTDEIAAFAAFANERLDGYALGTGTPQSASVTIRFLRDDQEIDTMEAGGAGSAYFIARESDHGRVLRRLSLEDVAALAKLIGRDPADLFQP